MRSFRKAAIIVKCAQHGKDLFPPRHPAPFVGTFPKRRRQDVVHLLVGETAQIVVFIQMGDDLDHVVAAGDIAHDHRGDAGDEDPIQPAPLGAGLHGLEKELDDAFAPHQFLVTVDATHLAGHDLVGEVVVFVDDEIELVAGGGYDVDEIPQRDETIRRVPFDGLWQVVMVIAVETADAAVDMPMERGGDGVRVAIGIDLGEVEPQHEVAVAFRCRISSDFQIPEQFLEPIRPSQIVVVFQHREPKTLAETTRTQEEELIAGLLDEGNTIRAIDVEVVFLTDFLKIREAVGESDGHFGGDVSWLDPLMPLAVANPRNKCNGTGSR